MKQENKRFGSDEGHPLPAKVAGKDIVLPQEVAVKQNGSTFSISLEKYRENPNRYDLAEWETVS